MSYPIAVGYFGCTSPKISTAGIEILQQHKPDGWTDFKAYKFNFYNTEACTVIVNGSPIYLRAGQNFSMNTPDKPIKTFVVLEVNINYVYNGAY